MKTYTVKHKFAGTSKITELASVDDFLDFLKTQPIAENDEKYIAAIAGDFKEVCSFFLNGLTPVYAIDNGDDPISYQYLADWDDAA